MTPDTFTHWLADMKSAGLIRFDVDAARELGVTPETITHWKKGGVPEAASRRTALSCTALLHRMEPYGEGENR